MSTPTNSKTYDNLSSKDSPSSMSALFAYQYTFFSSLLIFPLNSPFSVASVIPYTSDLSPLDTSLLYCLKSLTTMCPSLIKDIVLDNNPCKVKSEKENTSYWVRNDGSPLLLSFPVILDTHGKYGQTGPYFNMMNNVCLFPFYSLYIQHNIIPS